MIYVEFFLSCGKTDIGPTTGRYPSFTALFYDIGPTSGRYANTNVVILYLYKLCRHLRLY